MLNVLLGGALGVVVWLICIVVSVWLLKVAEAEDDADAIEACEQTRSVTACACWVIIGAFVGVLTL